MVPHEEIVVLDKSPFYDTKMTSTGELSFLGTAWRRTVASAGSSVPIQV